MSIHGKTLLIVLSTAFLLTSVPAVATEEDSQATVTVPIYKPPMRGAPATRVGGASRGELNSGLILSVLAPESTAWTSQAQPTLYWYSSRGLTAPLEFTLIDEQAIKPLVEMPVKAPQPGIYALHLDYSLKPGMEYAWSIVAIADLQQRAGDTLASGTIQRIQPSPSFVAQLKDASKSQLPFLYAQGGYWYDALAVLSEQIDANPADRRLRVQRAAFLDQVGLGDAAAHDRGTPP